MNASFSTGLGKVSINEQVISAVAGRAATECYGIVGMSSKTVQDGLAELLGFEQVDRGVGVRIEEDLVTVDLHIIVQYGVRISEVANNVRAKVKYAVETLLGLKVACVNIHVEGVHVTGVDTLG
ncbi:MAG: Asp23/Gls24 family envelope stress response protein [Limnochordia bacterium]